jgi:hypothetical protein
MMVWAPRPFDTAGVTLPAEVAELLEVLAEHAHDTWGAHRIEQGWVYGPERDDGKKEHPMLVPYGELSENEKESDRRVAREVLKVLLRLGYRIVPPSSRNIGAAHSSAVGARPFNVG